MPLDYNPVLAVIFFHGLQIRNGDKAWATSWWQRHNGEAGKLVCWPKEWLPRDLGERNVVVYSLSYDADAIQWKGRGQIEDVQEIGKDLIHKLVASQEWGLEQMQAIALVGHSFGGLVLKSLVVEARKLATLPEAARRNATTRKTSDSCKAFLRNVKCAVFYGTRHSGSDAATLAKTFRRSRGCQHSRKSSRISSPTKEPWKSCPLISKMLLEKTSSILPSENFNAKYVTCRS